MTRIIPRLVFAIPLGVPPAALFTLDATTLALTGLDLDNQVVPFVAQLRAVVFVAVWAVLIYWTAWETDSIRRAVSRTCWAFTVASFLIPMASVSWGFTSLPDKDQIIIPKSFIVFVMAATGVVLGLVGLLFAKLMSPSAAQEQEAGWLLRDTRETVRRIGDARTATVLALPAVGVVGIHVGVAEGSWSEKYTEIETTGLHTCGVRTDGTAHCWGDGRREIPPQDERIASIAVGPGFACGLREDGSLACWGRMTLNSVLGVPADPDWWAVSRSIAEVPARYGYVCEELPNGIIECSREYASGEVSRLTANSASFIRPSLETSMGPFTRVTAGGNHVCGLHFDGTVVCWGGNESGEASPPEGEVFAEISAGSSHTCGLGPDGVGVCWGSVDSPPDSERLSSISSGNGYSCGIQVEGDVVCWGDNRLIAERPSVGMSVVAVSSGSSHACGLRSDGSVACWGATTEYENYPFGSDYVKGDRFVQISSGDNYNCGLLKNGTAKCWGGIRFNRFFR